MKNVMKYMLIISLATAITAGKGLAQKAVRKTARVQVEYFKGPDKTENLVATLIVKEKRYVPFGEAMLYFYCLNDTARILLDKIKTNDAGKAVLTVSNNPKITKDPEGKITFIVEYKGSSAVKAAQRKMAIRQGDLELSFFQKDSTKSIEVSATETGADNQRTPIAKVNILFYVQGTFSLYNFAKEKTDENGIVQVAFPVDMPGDTTGVLTIVAKIEENRTYGTIEAKGEINWGKPIQPVKEKKRGLGDTDAPLWMVYTLIVLLSAVWFHYLYVVYMMIKIKLAR